MDADSILTPEDQALVKDIRVYIAHALASDRDTQVMIGELTDALVERGWPENVASPMIAIFVSDQSYSA